MNLPDGMFDPGRRFTHADMPLLRSMREAYRQLLAAVQAEAQEQKKPAQLLALAKVKAEVLAKFHVCGDLLSRLERLPAGRRL